MTFTPFPMPPAAPPAAPPTRVHTFVLDFDDTLFPSTWLRHLAARTRRGQFSDAAERKAACVAFAAYAAALRRFFAAMDAVSPNRALIITGSGGGWVRYVSPLVFDRRQKDYAGVLRRLEAMQVVEVAPFAKKAAFGSLAMQARADGGALFALSDFGPDRPAFLDACDAAGLAREAQRHVRFVPAPSVAELAYQLDQMTASVAYLAARTDERVDLAISITYNMVPGAVDPPAADIDEWNDDDDERIDRFFEAVEAAYPAASSDGTTKSVAVASAR